MTTPIFFTRERAVAERWLFAKLTYRIYCFWTSYCWKRDDGLFYFFSNLFLFQGECDQQWLD